MTFFAGGLALVGMASGWIGYPLGGWPGAVISACIVLAVATIIGRRLTRDAIPTAPAAPDALPAARAGGYVRYGELDARLRAALRDGRSYASVLAPTLREVAGDVALHRRGRRLTDEQLGAALGSPAWGLVTVRPGERDRDDVVSEADIGLVLRAVERL